MIARDCLSGAIPVHERSKSCTRLEPIAHKRESAVDIIAAIMPHTTNASTKSLVISVSMGMRGLVFGTMSILVIFACIPK